MQAGRALVQQPGAEIAHHVDAEIEQALQVVTVGLQAFAQPTRDLGAAGIGETGQVRVVGDGLMPGTMGISMPRFSQSSTKRQ